MYIVSFRKEKASRNVRNRKEQPRDTFRSVDGPPAQLIIHGRRLWSFPHHRFNITRSNSARERYPAGGEAGRVLTCKGRRPGERRLTFRKRAKIFRIRRVASRRLDRRRDNSCVDARSKPVKNSAPSTIGKTCGLLSAARFPWARTARFLDISERVVAFLRPYDVSAPPSWEPGWPIN